MFQLSMSNNRQHQTLALNSLIMNNIFNLTNCFNQFGAFNLRSGFRNHPFMICVLLLSVFVQVSLTELNAFGLENLSPIQWFVCFVFAALSALIAPLTGQQDRQRAAKEKLSQNLEQGHHFNQPKQSPHKAKTSRARSKTPTTPKAKINKHQTHARRKSSTFAKYS